MTVAIVLLIVAALAAIVVLVLLRNRSAHSSAAQNGRPSPMTIASETPGMRRSIASIFVGCRYLP